MPESPQSPPSKEPLPPLPLYEGRPAAEQDKLLVGDDIPQGANDGVTASETVNSGTSETLYNPLLLERTSRTTRTLAGVRRYAKRGAIVASFGAALLAVKGHTPHPEVNPASSAMMIEANDAIRNAGEAALVLGGLSIAAGYAYRRRSPAFDASLRSTKGNTLAQGANLALMSLLIGTSAAGSALGDAAAEGAGKPIAEIAGALSPDAPDETIFITQHAHTLPFDHSELPASQMGILSQAVTAQGGELVPYSLLLGDARHMAGDNNPSSSAIVLLPNQAIEQKYGITLDNDVDAAGNPVCGTGRVIINEQFGSTPNERILVEGQQFEVAQTIEAYPGLDRSLAVASLEEAGGCITSKDILSGAAISGLSHEQVQTVLEELNLPYSALEYAEYQQQYTDFWDKSVKPPEMQLISYLWLASIAGLGAVKIGEINRRRPLIAAQYRDGVSRNSLAGAEFPRAMVESAKALGYATIPALGFIVLNASSQYGIAETFDTKALGAGFTIGLAANLVGAGMGAAYVRKMNMASAERAK